MPGLLQGLPGIGRFAILAGVLLCGAAGQTAASREAVAAMQRGDFASAEKTLRAELQSHPNDPWVLSLLGVALDNEKKIAEAEEFHRQAVAGSPHSAEILTNYGTHLWSGGQYEKAEGVFAEALAAAPSFFTALFNLGVMATYNGHYERAREALTSALQMKPQSVDVLYRLASVDEATRQWETAAMHLAQAAKLDPQRAAVQRQLAIAATELGALDDAAAAWDRYLKLEPGDDIARRERAYAWARAGKAEQGITELEAFVARHPEDAVGYYEIGQSERIVDLTKALTHLDRAVALRPDYAAALSARGALYYQEGKPDAAVKDLEMAASIEPEDAVNLDRLGQTYQALERPADAVRTLRRAAELAPGDSKTILHFARALADAGQAEESKAVMERFRQMGPDQSKGVPPGLVEYLSLSPERRRAEYRARVEKAVRDRPDDPTAQLEYLKALLEDGKAEEVAAAAGRIAGMKPGAAVLAQAGQALLAAGYDPLAKGLLEPASAAGADVALDLALATLHAAPATADAGAIERALEGAGNRPDLYLRETAFLVKRGRAQEALRLIGDAVRAMPENRDLLLMKATTLDLAGQTGEAGLLLERIQTQWPEWSAARVAHGILLDTHQQYVAACHALETAVALGARSTPSYFYLADCSLRAGRKDAAEAHVAEALKLAGNDPWVQFLGGRIALERGQYPVAVDRLSTAIRLRPKWIEAHHTLAQAYNALGRKQEAGAELAAAAKLPTASADDTPPYLRSLYQGSLFLTAKF